MHYSAYYNDGTDDGNIDCAVAYADALPGPWTKDPANPVYTDVAAGQFSQNGGMVWDAVNGYYVLAYNAGGGGIVWIARGTNLHSLARVGTVAFSGGDPFLRVRQDTGAIECYFVSGNSIYRRTSTDGGSTWSAAVYVVDSSSFGNGREPSVYVPPGGEGHSMFVATDYYIDGGTLSLGRGIMLASTTDGGATWSWQALLIPGGATWEHGSVFDSFMIHNAGTFYVFHSGIAGSDNGTLNMGIQIGHASCAWNPPS